MLNKVEEQKKIYKAMTKKFNLYPHSLQCGLHKYTEELKFSGVVV